MNVSICMTYFNRPEQLRNTLASISRFTMPHEIIIVDDASDFKAENVIADFPNLPIVSVYINKRKKWWVNPCIPFNMSFRLITGDNVIIQNAECAHHTDIVGYVSTNVSDKYHAFSCYSQDSSLLPLDQIQFLERQAGSNGGNGWYNHPTHRPNFYHFCAAMSKDNLMKVGGFDEEFATGIAYDDDAFVKMIRNNQIEMINDHNAIAIHQYHYSIPAPPNAAALINQNRVLFNRKYGK